MQIQNLTIDMLLEGAYVHINPESDDVSIFFQTALSTEELCKNSRTENCLETLRAALLMLNFGKINSDCPPFEFLKDYSNQKNPYQEVSFLFLQLKIEEDFKMYSIENKHNQFLYDIISCITQWIHCFGFWNSRNTLLRHTQNMVWNDAAVGVRLIVLSYVLQRLLHQHDFDKYMFERILRTAFDHYLLLSSRFFYNPRTNHGFFQNIALFCFCHVFPWINGSDAAVELAEKRFVSMLHEQLSTEGFLKEHSTTYHTFFLSSHLSVLKNIPLSSQAKITILQYIYKMTAALRSFILPDGGMALLGDSYSSHLGSELTLCLREHPTSEKQPVSIFPSAGYGFMCTETTQSCIIFAGAFHSRTHKHCDDLHFVWSEANENILIDSGMIDYLGKISPDDPRFAKGFWYSDPKRIYIESVHAHNTVEINGESYSRKVKPYGVLPIKGSVLASTILYLHATWERPEGYIQERTLILQPRQWLLVLDDLVRPTTAQASSNKFSQWFQLNPQAKLLPQELTASIPNHAFSFSTGLCLYCKSLLFPATSSLHLGETEPRMQGWYAVSREELAPTYSLGFHTCGYNANFATLFSLNKQCIDCMLTETETTKQVMEISFSDGSKDSFPLPSTTQIISRNCV